MGLEFEDQPVSLGQSLEANVQVVVSAKRPAHIGWSLLKRQPLNRSQLQVRSGLWPLLPLLPGWVQAYHGVPNVACQAQEHIPIGLEVACGIDVLSLRDVRAPFEAAPKPVEEHRPL